MEIPVVLIASSLMIIESVSFWKEEEAVVLDALYALDLPSWLQLSEVPEHWPLFLGIPPQFINPYSEGQESKVTTYLELSYCLGPDQQIHAETH